MHTSITNLATLPPMFLLSNQQSVVSQLTGDPRLLRLYGSQPMRFAASWVEANYGTDIAAVANDTLWEPTLITLMTHVTNCRGETERCGHQDVK